MKTETWINIALFAALGVAIWAIIEKGKDFIGDNPLGSVGGDDPYADPDSPEYPGWLTWMFIYDSNPYLFLQAQGRRWNESFEEGGVTYEDAWASGYYSG